MKIWNLTSSERRKDIRTGKKTGHYICFESSGFLLNVPTNVDDYNGLAEKSKAVERLMRLIKKELKAQP